MKSIKMELAAALLIFCLAGSGCGAGGQQETAPAQQTAAEETPGEALQEEGEKAEEGQGETEGEDGRAIYGEDLKDGVYSINVDSSSSMFRITKCELIVSGGNMTAVMTMGGTGYLKLFMGTGEEAKEASQDEMIPYEEQPDGVHTFRVPVEALDVEIPCSAFSARKETWYDRILVFRSDTIPADAFSEGKGVSAESLKLEDGVYTAEVSLGGGSGRAEIQSPAVLTVEDGNVYARIAWGSSNYDYMKVGDEKFLLLEGEENSVFLIPVAGFDQAIPVVANTIAMSRPYEIQYTLTFDSETIKRQEEGEGKVSASRKMELTYADQFSIEYLEDGSAMITIQDGGRFLAVEEGGEIPPSLPEDVTVIRKPLTNIYLAATSAMDLFCSLDALGRISLSGTDEAGWYVEEAKKAMEDGSILYGGKYNAPDYELILSKGCDLAVESTMIYHSPEVKEQLERLGIPVLVERSSYESHPLGRMEWIKLYGALLGKEELAEELFDQQAEKVEKVIGQENTGKTVAFFYITSSGTANIRKQGDYVAEMIRLAGGEYVPADTGGNENALSTMNMQMEAFYAAAKDADYMIYNSAIDGELEYIDQLLEKDGLLADFKAVKEGNVWCTGKNMFQETMGLGDMIADIHRILTEEEPDSSHMVYIHKLKKR